MAASTSASAAVRVSSASPIGAGAAPAELVGAVPLVATGMGETTAAAPARPTCLKRPRRDRVGRASESSVSFGIFPSPSYLPVDRPYRAKIVIFAGCCQSTLALLQDQRPPTHRAAAAAQPLDVPPPTLRGSMLIPLSQAPRPGYSGRLGEDYS